nr:hypothetical protein [Spirochaetota bacterium]
MKNIIIIAVFVFAIFFSCKVAEKRVYYRAQKINKIYYDLSFSDEARVNGKIFIDNTEDLDIIINLYDKQKKRAEENKKNREKALKNIVVKKEQDLTDDDLRDNSSDGFTENTKDSSDDEVVVTNDDNTGDILDEDVDSFSDASSDLKDKSSFKVRCFQSQGDAF